MPAFGQVVHHYKVPVETREFTPSQRQLARMMAIGMSAREMAKELGRTYYGVKQQIRKVNDKSGMSNRVEFAMWYWKHFPEELELKRTAEVVLR